jgi:CheY-like chemotaxis protein
MVLLVSRFDQIPNWHDQCMERSVKTSAVPPPVLLGLPEYRFESPETGLVVEQPFHILIADDDYITRRVLTLLLERIGYRVECVENGLECLHAALAHNHELILMDIDMPGMDGIECATCLRKVGVDIPIYGLVEESGKTFEMVSQHGREAGMDGCLAKPVNGDKLRQTLNAAFLTRREEFLSSFVG